MKQDCCPELKDIIEMIRRYNASHPESCFIYNFIGFKKVPNEYCDECGGQCSEIDDTKSEIGALGDIETLRMLSNTLRDLIEDTVDEEGVVNY